ncbi:hypothetical protein VTP01DRAFT_1736 [Rhizomucor pusillus]|uniref:uncharacterized protein n=1 Tax=Rhizomucor pusillus TaxID=4840 RepID=UPI003744A360
MAGNAQGERINGALFLSGIALRLALFSFPVVADALSSRIELATPVTSYKRLKEGVFLYDNGVAPYDGGPFHQAPLLLCIFSFLESIPFYYTTPVLYSLIDAAIALCLQKITLLHQTQDAEKPKLAIEKDKQPIHPSTVAALYLFNPLAILSCISRSSVIFTNLSIVVALLWAQLGRTNISMCWAAVATYFGFYPAMLVPPLIMIDKKCNVGHAIGCYLAGLGVLLGLSRLLVGSWNFIPATYGVVIFLSDLTPNVGMFWYFFIEIFDQFRSFFMVIFQFHAFIFAAPLCIRLREHPLFVCAVLTGVMSVFKSYPAAGDVALFLGLVPLHQQLFKYCRYGFLVANIFLYSSVLAPIFWHLWIYAGSGNANFFYAITLVYNLGQALLIVDLIYAILRREYDIAHPENIGKVVIHK